MPKCTASEAKFPPCKRRRVQAEFSGGDITSDAGIVLLRRVDKRIRLIVWLAGMLPDPREQARCEQGLQDFLRQ